MLNTAFIEHFNAKMREGLAMLTRKSRHAMPLTAALHTGMYLVGTTYNFCWVHHELSSRRDEMTGKRRVGKVRTPAMAAGLTDHVWNVLELLTYKVTLSEWIEPKRRGRPRKEVLCSTTS